MKRARQPLSILHGFAILAVLCNHASILGLNLLETESHSAAAYGLIVMNQLPMFAVPAFLFLSGYFVAYAARGDPPILSWRVIRGRLETLLWPYLVWSLVIYAGQMATGKGYSFGEFGRRFLLGQVALPYYFVPLLVQFYLLAPVFVRYTKKRGVLLLVVSAAIQLTTMVLFYLRIYNVRLAAPLEALIDAGPVLFVRWTLFFALGSIVRCNRNAFKARLAPFKWWLLAAALLLGVLSVVESEVAIRYVDTLSEARHMTKLSTTLFSLTVILFFVALDRVQFPLAGWIQEVGVRSYGIYLIHYHILLYALRGLNQVTPWLLSRRYLLQGVLMAVGLVVPLVMMVGVAKSPARRLYRLVFG
jgi:membrane-bound acyltransferase YfiQ involved in biofilm formation